MDYQLSNISLLKKLSLISVLSTNVTESNLMSGGIFTDVRTSLYSRMLETVKKKWEPLALSRFLPEGTMPDTYLDWVYTQLLEYKDKDMYLNPTYINETITPEIENQMKKVISSIKDGSFASKLDTEEKNNYPQVTEFFNSKKKALITNIEKEIQNSLGKFTQNE